MTTNLLISLSCQSKVTSIISFLIIQLLTKAWGRVILVQCNVIIAAPTLPKRSYLYVYSTTLTLLLGGTLHFLWFQHRRNESLLHHFATHTVIFVATSRGIKTGKVTIILFAMSIVTLDDTRLVLETMMETNATREKKALPRTP